MCTVPLVHCTSYLPLGLILHATLPYHTKQQMIPHSIGVLQFAWHGILTGLYAQYLSMPCSVCVCVCVCVCVQDKTWRIERVKARCGQMCSNMQQYATISNNVVGKCARWRKLSKASYSNVLEQILKYLNLHSTGA